MMQPWDRLLLVRVKGFEDYREDDWMVTPLTAAELERIQKAAPTCVPEPSQQPPKRRRREGKRLASTPKHHCSRLHSRLRG